MADFQPSQFDPGALSRAGTDPHIEVLVHKVTRMANDMDKLTESIGEMSRSMTRLVLAEERIATVMTSIERVNKRLDDGAERFRELDEKVTTLCGQMDALKSTTNRTSDWVDKAVLAAAGAAAMFVADRVGLF